MKLTLDQFILKTNNLDKILIVLIFLIPILLSLSIFLADLSASLVGLILLFLVFQKKDIWIFGEVKNQIYFFSIFYFLILISLIFSISIEDSFASSFFYFRYFLLILGIFYLLKKYKFFDKILFYSIIFTFTLVLFDSIFQYIFLKNILNYPANVNFIPGEGKMYILTSFFDEEKKLGSYLIRLLPLLISLLYYFNFKKINYVYFALTGIIIFFTSERTALFLFVIFSFFYFLIIKKKIQFLIFGLLILTSLLIFNKDFRYKYLSYTLMQLNITKTYWNQYHGEITRYYSKEHEDLSFTAYQIFKNNILTGSGIKTFYKACNELKIEKKLSTLPDRKSFRDLHRLKIDRSASFFKRNNSIKCSTHPHNMYFQILSDTGIFIFIFVVMFFIYIFKKILKIIFKKNKNNVDLCFYFLSIGIILNIWPLIPSGNFYNNWMSLILFYPFGLWLYIHQKLKNND